jgi:hypothetical protein
MEGEFIYFLNQEVIDRVNFTSIIRIILCVSLVLLLGIASLSYAVPEQAGDSETNVITASDAGGGDITQRELLWIILAFVVLLFLIIVARM